MPPSPALAALIPVAVLAGCAPLPAPATHLDTSISLAVASGYSHPATRGFSVRVSSRTPNPIIRGRARQAVVRVTIPRRMRVMASIANEHVGDPEIAGAAA